jgi:hypothetical protein
LQTLEQRTPHEGAPIRPTVPFWLLEELKPQGLRYDEHGVIEWASLRAITAYRPIEQLETGTVPEWKPDA